MMREAEATEHWTDVELAPPNGSRKLLRLLGVGADSRMLRDLARVAEPHAAALESVAQGDAAHEALANREWDAVVVVLDTESQEEVATWHHKIAELATRPRLVVMVPAPTIAFTLRATQLGGIDVVPLPLWQDHFSEALRRLCATFDETALPLPEVVPIAVGPYQLVSGSPAMLNVYRTIAQIAPGTATVLIVGESGTGKELVARAIHQHGNRAASPFVAVNCAAIPENLLESELFGHEKGAFTGAVARKIGRMERASGGTLLLDEIADMSLVLQSKILRAIQEREIERVGGNDPIPVDVRLMAATNRDLPALIAQGRFREDLYYRLAVVTVRVPRLIERGDDVLLLTSHYLREFGRQYGKRFSAISDRALELMRSQRWVGNVRELRNVIERAVAVAEGGTLRAEHLPEEWRGDANAVPAPRTPPLLSLQDVEARHIAETLARTKGHIGEAARILGVHRNTLARKMKEHRL
ncbi:MAG: sigma-54 dependent transcriptional regulator [Planctomycetes bacterium]|nr:sigma-54 dependent transcriptional regulator [Planctomycetota bacterium]